MKRRGNKALAEYLAPGVYVEETSFRAKSIEGVSTSTTGFVGPTRKGPVGSSPELLTSLGDFERIYGSLNDLSYGTNYLAHSVRAYFNEGGSRLYVSRAYLAGNGTDGIARSTMVVDGGSANERARFVARSPGDAGNGRIIIRQVATPATVRTMGTAPAGSTVRVGNSSPAGFARLTGGTPPFSVPDGGTLRLIIDGADSDITFRGEPAEAVGTVQLADPVDLDDANTSLRVTIDALTQTLTLPVASTPRAEFILNLNRQIRGGYVRLTDAGDGGQANRLVVGSDRRGSRSSVTVTANPELGFAANTTVLGSANPDNNVGDLSDISADEVGDLLQAEGHAVNATLSSTGQLIISTNDPGAARTLNIGNVAGSVHAELGLPNPGGPNATGTDGATLAYFVKGQSGWRDADDNLLNLTGLGPGAAPPGGAEILLLNVVAEDKDQNSMIYADLGFDPQHPRWIGNVLHPSPTRRSDQLDNLFALECGSGVSAHELRNGLFATVDERVIDLSGGDDGAAADTGRLRGGARASSRGSRTSRSSRRPAHSAYADVQGDPGRADLPRRAPQGLPHRRARHAAGRARPAEAAGGAQPDRLEVRGPLLPLGGDRPTRWPARATADIAREMTLPPSGFVCGIYARNDVERGVYKAPANEVVRGALRFETDINFAQQEVLNPARGQLPALSSRPRLPGLGRAHRQLGSRVEVRQRPPLLHLPGALDRQRHAVGGLRDQRRAAVGERPGDDLQPSSTTSGVTGRCSGRARQEAYFVRCDRSTMTQNDLDNGRLVCLIGVAVLKPAEFVIFRIGQKTADART